MFFDKIVLGSSQYLVKYVTRKQTRFFENASKCTKKNEEVSLFGWQSGFPTVSETHAQVRHFQSKKVCKYIKKAVVFFILDNTNCDPVTDND